MKRDLPPAESLEEAVDFAADDADGLRSGAARQAGHGADVTNRYDDQACAGAQANLTRLRFAS